MTTASASAVPPLRSKAGSRRPSSGTDDGDQEERREQLDQGRRPEEQAGGDVATRAAQPAPALGRHDHGQGRHREEDGQPVDVTVVHDLEHGCRAERVERAPSGVPVPPSERHGEQPEHRQLRRQAGDLPELVTRPDAPKVVGGGEPHLGDRRIDRALAGAVDARAAERADAGRRTRPDRATTTAPGACSAPDCRERWRTDRSPRPGPCRPRCSGTGRPTSSAGRPGQPAAGRRRRPGSTPPPPGGAGARRRRPPPPTPPPRARGRSAATNGWPRWAGRRPPGRRRRPLLPRSGQRPPARPPPPRPERSHPPAGSAPPAGPTPPAPPGPTTASSPGRGGPQRCRGELGSNT